MSREMSRDLVLEKINVRKLLKAIEKHCERKDITTGYFGLKYLNNAHVYERLKGGSHVSINTYNKIVDIIGER